jgi:hypothetical protein
MAMRKTFFLACAAILLVLATSSDAKAWFAYHYSGYRYGGGAAAYGGYHYGGYHYGGGGGYQYGYARRW